jgi:hypothetical protein
MGDLRPMIINGVAEESGSWPIQASKAGETAAQPQIGAILEPGHQLLDLMRSRGQPSDGLALSLGLDGWRHMREPLRFGGPSTIGGRDTARTRIRFALPAGCAVTNLPIDAISDSDGLVTVTVDDPTGALQRLTSWALRRHIVLDQLTVDRPSLGVGEVLRRLVERRQPRRRRVHRGFTRTGSVAAA